MGSSSSRRFRRELSKIEVRQAQWKLWFYCWRWIILLMVATAQAIELAIAILEHRTPQISVQIHLESLFGTLSHRP
ncbi:MAG TPA: hypothetical protein VIH71_12700 [Solirubrobacteraceae bacterium]